MGAFIKSLHFVLMVLTAALGVCLKFNILIPPAGRWHWIAVGALCVLFVCGWGAAAAWLPPDVRAQLEGILGSSSSSSSRSASGFVRLELLYALAVFAVSMGVIVLSILISVRQHTG